MMQPKKRRKKSRFVDGRVSGERALASRYASFYADVKMIEWVGLAETLPAIAKDLGVAISGMRRTQIAIACMAEMIRQGLRLPDDYVPSWQKAPNLGIIYKSKRLNGRVSNNHGS